MAESRRMWGGFKFSILVLMIILLLCTDQRCAADAVKKNKSISNQCGGSNKEECLIADNEEMEFLLDSEASRRVLQTNNNRPTSGALNPGQAVFCDRPNSPRPCTPKPNSGRKVPPNCSPQSFSKDCHRF